ncbi:hypothetical protein DIE03_03865 [Burkholderia sp. Bp8992]|nr:hypothetical protein DIE03_03865 [Burkholderia sp. Bp8992]
MRRGAAACTAVSGTQQRPSVGCLPDATRDALTGASRESAPVAASAASRKRALVTHPHARDCTRTVASRHAVLAASTGVRLFAVRMAAAIDAGASGWNRSNG